MTIYNKFQPKLLSEAQSPMVTSLPYHFIAQTQHILNPKEVTFSCGALPWESHDIYTGYF